MSKQSVQDRAEGALLGAWSHIGTIVWKNFAGTMAIGLTGIPIRNQVATTTA